MNAQVFLDRANVALRAGDTPEANAALDVYARWRDLGGAEPVGGDTLHNELRLQVFMTVRMVVAA